MQQEQAQAANGIGANGKPVLTKVEDFGIKLAHQFPWAPAAAVAVGLALRRRFLSSPDAPSGVVRRLQVTKVRVLAGSQDCICSNVINQVFGGPRTSLCKGSRSWDRPERDEEVL